VEAALPLLGRIVRYSGWLRPLGASAGVERSCTEQLAVNA
jgi:hypothetical protein